MIKTTLSTEVVQSKFFYQYETFINFMKLFIQCETA